MVIQKIDFKVIIFAVIVIFGLIMFLFRDRNFSTTKKEPSTFCGGVADLKCPKSYKCIFESDSPNAAGICQKLK